MIPKVNYHLPSSDFVPLLCGLSQMPSFSLGALHLWLNLLAWILCKGRDCVLVVFLVLHMVDAQNVTFGFSHLQDPTNSRFPS